MSTDAQQNNYRNITNTARMRGSSVLYHHIRIKRTHYNNIHCSLYKHADQLETASNVVDAELVWLDLSSTEHF